MNNNNNTRRAAIWAKNTRRFMEAGQYTKALRSARHAVRNLEAAGVDAAEVVDLIEALEKKVS